MDELKQIVGDVGAMGDGQGEVKEVTDVDMAYTREIELHWNEIQE